MSHVRRAPGAAHPTRSAARRSVTCFLVGLLALRAAAAGAAEPEVRVVVTASRLPAPAERVPGHVTVIDREEIERSSARTVVDLLDRASGVDFRSYSGTGTDAAVRVRGYGTGHVQFLLDGRPINPPDLDRITWLAVPLAAVERIEIVRGGASAVHGTNAVAATVNVITREVPVPPAAAPATAPAGAAPAGAGPAVSVGLKGYLGSFGTAGGEAYIAAAAGPLAVSGAYTQTTTDGQRERSAADAQSLQLSLGLPPGTDPGADPDPASFGLDTRLSYTSTAREFPGPLTDEQFDDDPDQSLNPADGAATTGYGVLVSPQWWIGDVTVAGPVGLSVEETETDFASFADHSDTTITQADLRPAVSATLLPGDEVGLDLEAAGDAVFTRLDYTKYATARRDDVSREVRLEERVGALSLGAELSVAELVYLSARGRADLRRVAASSDEADAVEGEVRQQGLAARAGLVLRPADELRLFLRYDRVFRLPLLDEQVSFQGFGDAFYDDLDPERGNSVDVGVEIEPAEVLRIAASGYFLAMEEEIASVEVTPGVFEQRNVEETERVGADVEARLSAGEVLSVQGAYSYVLARYAAGENEGNRIPGVPSHTVTLSARAALPAALVLEPGWEYTSEYYLDEANDADPDYARTRLSAYLSWYPGRAVGGTDEALESARLYVGVENILDDRAPSLASYTSFSGVTVYPENGRSWHGGFSWSY